MKLRELLSKMKEVQQKIGASEPYICGGTPRDRYLGHLENIADLDITTGDKTVDYLSQEFEIELRKQYKVSRTTATDGHSTIHLGEFKMDFSSNFNAPNIEPLLSQKGIKNPTDMQKEMFSRDFTCNALLLSLDLKQLSDPTHQGFDDIKKKIIKTCLDPNITLTTNKNRVIRAIYLASKLDFDIDPKIVEYVAKNPQVVKISTNKVLIEKLNDAFAKDPDKASFYLTKMHLWDHIPITQTAQPYYMKAVSMPQKKAYYLGGGGVNEPTPGKTKYKVDPAIVVQPRFKEPFYHNYDLYMAPGVNDDAPAHTPGVGYHHLMNYKSIKEYLEDVRKFLRGKYVADDSYITDNNYKERERKMNVRAAILAPLVKEGQEFLGDKNKLDFISDDEVTPILSGSESYSDSVQIGGLLDKYLPPNDFEGKSTSELDFGRDYTEDSIDKNKKINELLDQYLNNIPTHGLYGLPDGVDLPDEDLGDPTNLNPDYGTYGPESLMYEDKWNI